MNSLATLPIEVQGELVRAESQIVMALVACIEKFGTNGELVISQYEAVNLLKGKKNVALLYDFEQMAMRMKVV